VAARRNGCGGNDAGVARDAGHSNSAGTGIDMESYLFSLGAGVLIGVVYSVINVRSPAPPLIALIGLAGMLVGEWAIGPLRHWLGL
jgi:XapX domain-containing protein